MRGEPEAAGMGNALPVAEHEVRTEIKFLEGSHQCWDLPEREEAREIRERTFDGCGDHALDFAACGIHQGDSGVSSRATVIVGNINARNFSNGVG